MNDCLKKLFFKEERFFAAGMHQLQILSLTANLVGKGFKNESKG